MSAVPFPEAIENYTVPGTQIVFYGDPATLTEAQIDPLLWPIVQRINESGWVWTAEACQGHPEDETAGGPWAGNHRAMIRLVCRIGDLGRLLVTVAEAVMPVFDDGEFSPLAWEPWVSYRPDPNPRYAEALIYIGWIGQHVGGRDRALRAWSRFAGRVAAPAPHPEFVAACKYGCADPLTCTYPHTGCEHCLAARLRSHATAGERE